MQSKIEAMAEEAREAEEAALAALREAEANATEEELSRVLDALERDKAEAEADLKRQLEVGLLRIVDSNLFCGVMVVESSSWTMERLAAKTKASIAPPADF